MNRFKASGIHFTGSALVLFLVFALVRWIWYPGRLFNAASGADLVMIVVLVDVVLGPLITLIIFNPKKSSLKFDMACVLACQIGFMLYGAWSIYSARPVYFAFVENSFYLVTANEVDPQDQEKAKDSAFRSLPVTGPQMVGTRQPDDKAMNENVLFAGLAGMGLQNLPEYFIPYAETIPRVRAAGKTANNMTGIDKEDRQRLSAYETQQRAEGKSLLFLPLRNKRIRLYVAVDSATGAVIEIL